MNEVCFHNFKCCNLYFICSVPIPQCKPSKFKKKNFKFKTNFSSYSSLMLSVSSFPPSVNFTVNAHMEASTMHTLISFVLVTYNIGKPTTRRHTKYSEIFIKISTFEWKWQLSKQRPPFCLRVILLYQGLKFLHYIHSSTYQKFAFKH